MTEGCVNVRCCDAVVCVGVVRIIRDASFGCCEQDWVVIANPSARPAALLRALGSGCPAPPGRVWALDPGSGLPGSAVRDVASRRMSPQLQRQVLALDKPLARTDNKSARIVLSAVADLIAPGASLGLGSNGGCDRCRLHHLKARRLDGVAPSYSPDRNTEGLTVVEQPSRPAI